MGSCSGGERLGSIPNDSKEKCEFIANEHSGDLWMEKLLRGTSGVIGDPG